MEKKQGMSDILQEANLVGFNKARRDDASPDIDTRKPIRAVTAKRDEDPIKEEPENIEQ